MMAEAVGLMFFAALFLLCCGLFALKYDRGRRGPGTTLPGFPPPAGTGQPRHPHRWSPAAMARLQRDLLMMESEREAEIRRQMFNASLRRTYDEIRADKSGAIEGGRPRRELPPGAGRSTGRPVRDVGDLFAQMGIRTVEDSDHRGSRA